jgi:hypothetical protein
MSYKIFGMDSKPGFTTYNWLPSRLMGCHISHWAGAQPLDCFRRSVSLSSSVGGIFHLTGRTEEEFALWLDSLRGW